jgi:hypothetical protein
MSGCIATYELADTGAARARPYVRYGTSSAAKCDETQHGAASKAPPVEGGTDGSNPLSSSGESANSRSHRPLRISTDDPASQWFERRVSIGTASSVDSRHQIKVVTRAAAGSRFGADSQPMDTRSKNALCSLCGKGHRTGVGCCPEHRRGTGRQALGIARRREPRSAPPATRVVMPKPATCSRRFMAGSPKASTRPTLKRQRPCSTS